MGYYHYKSCFSWITPSIKPAFYDVVSTSISINIVIKSVFYTHNIIFSLYRQVGIYDIIISFFLYPS